MQSLSAAAFEAYTDRSFTVRGWPKKKQKTWMSELCLKTPTWVVKAFSLPATALLSKWPFFSVFHSSACSSQPLPCLHNYLLPTTTFLRSYLFLPHLLYSMQPPNPPLPGRHVRLQEPCKWSPDCQSKGWSLHSDQRHDRYEPVTVTVRPVQSSRIYQQPPRSNLQPCQWGGHRETQGKASVVWVRAGNTVQKRLKRNN